jgi:hypothetical protein
MYCSNLHTFHSYPHCRDSTSCTCQQSHMITTRKYYPFHYCLSFVSPKGLINPVKTQCRQLFCWTSALNGLNHSPATASTDRSCTAHNLSYFNDLSTAIHKSYQSPENSYNKGRALYHILYSSRSLEGWTTGNPWCWHGENFYWFTSPLQVAPFKPHLVSFGTFNIKLHSPCHIPALSHLYFRIQYVNHLYDNGTTVIEILYLQTLISAKNCFTF